MNNRFASLLILTAATLLSGASSVPIVQVQDRRLTIDVQNVPLPQVLSVLKNEIGLQTVVTAEENSFRRATVSARFSNLSLETGMQRLLHGWSYALVNQDAPSGVRLFILGRKVESPSSENISHADQTAFPQPGFGNTLAEQDQKAAYYSAQETLVTEPPATESGLRAQLLSAQPEQRVNAISRLQSVPNGDFRESVRQLIRHDPSPEVRAAALDWLMLNDASPDALQLLQQVASGSDRELRTSAAEQLRLMQVEAARTAKVARNPKH